MTSISTWHWIILLIVVVVLFGGRGGDNGSGPLGAFATGLRAFVRRRRTPGR